METNPQKRWELLRKIDRGFLGLVPTFPPGRQWHHGQAPSGSWIEEEAPPIFSTALDENHVETLETWKFLWKFIIRTPSLVTFRHLVGAIHALNPVLLVPWLAGKSMMCRWFSQLQTSIYRGFPIAMFDYRRVMDLNGHFMDFISWFRTSSNLGSAEQIWANFLQLCCA